MFSRQNALLLFVLLVLVYKLLHQIMTSSTSMLHSIELDFAPLTDGDHSEKINTTTLQSQTIQTSAATINTTRLITVSTTR